MKRANWIVTLAAALAASCGGKSAPATDTTANPMRPPSDNPPSSGGTGTPQAPTSGKRAVAQPKLVAQPLAGDPTKTTIHRLSNGMTVYISSDKQEPSVVAYVAVHAGASYESRESTGLAHYLEHMLFKGTSKLGTSDYAKEKGHLDKIASLYDDLRKPGANRDQILKEIDSQTQAAAAFAIPNELDQLYSQLGVAGLNAFTNNDSTVYVTTVPKNRLSQWARVEAARYSDAVFRLFWPELEAVYEEKNRGLDSPERRVNEAFMKALFPDHGYGWSSVIGEVEHLKTPAYGDMVRFFERYYTPSNMAILLAGDVDESVLPLLEQEFGAFKRQPGPAAAPGKVASLTKRSEISVKVPANEGVVLGWPLVSATHPDRLAIEVMDLLLMDGSSGILARDLTLPQKVADAGCNPTFLRDAGYYELYADALDGQSHAELEKMLLELVGKLQRGEFTDTDLATAILTRELNQQRQLESNQGRMGMMLEAFIADEEWDAAVTKIDRMRKISKADVMRVAKQYLTPGMLVVKKVKGQEAPPKITKPGITPVKVEQGRRSDYASSILDMKIPPIEPIALAEGKDYVRGKLKTGELIAVKNERNNLFQVSYEFNYGRTDDRFACMALDVMKSSGAGKRTAEQTARALHELGLTIDTFCSKEESGITISGIDRNMEQGIALLKDWLASPAFDDKLLSAKVAAALTERSNAMKDPRSIGGAAQAYAAQGTDNEFLVVASNKQLQAVKPDQLKKILATFLKRKHRTSYFGPRAKDAAASAIALGDGSMPMRAQHVVKYRNPGSVFVTDQDTAQTQVLFTWPRKPANDNERAVGTVFGEYMSPLLYQQVREARGLAYTVFGGFKAGAKKQDPSGLIAYVATQSDKTHEAIDALLDTLKQPFEDQRLKLAHASIDESHRVDRIPPRFIAGTVYSWDDQGLKTDPRDKRVKAALAVDKAAAEKWTKAAVTAKPTISVVGNVKKLDLDKLGKLGKVEQVPVEKLFGY
jgi:predicted Zn-dependent peptidase